MEDTVKKSILRVATDKKSSVLSTLFTSNKGSFMKNAAKIHHVLQSL